MVIKKELLEILACPKCKGKVVCDDSCEFLICNKCWLRYPIEDGIPIMLIEKAVELD
jgi:uncharacterized protein YbaR (Trm112 family)